MVLMLTFACSQVVQPLHRNNWLRITFLQFHCINNRRVIDYRCICFCSIVTTTSNYLSAVVSVTGLLCSVLELPWNGRCWERSGNPSCFPGETLWPRAWRKTYAAPGGTFRVRCGGILSCCRIRWILRYAWPLNDETSFPREYFFVGKKHGKTNGNNNKTDRRLDLFFLFKAEYPKHIGLVWNFGTLPVVRHGILAGPAGETKSGLTLIRTLANPTS